MKFDFLIIGQGLAGSLLAFELIQRGFKVFVIDNGLENASQVAAGLINPVTGMRFVKSSDVDVLLPFAKNHYQALERFFKQSFYIKKPMLRLLKNNKEIENARKRLDNPDYATYLSGIVENEKFGMVLEQQQTAYLLIVRLLVALKQFFISRQCYQQASLDYKEIKLSEFVSYQAIKAKQLIFCEGYLARDNPWFSYLPFQLVKGEILTLQHQQVPSSFLLNYGHWMIPLDDFNFRTGATFDRENINTQVTESGRDELLTSLKVIMPELAQAEFIKQQANVRPCTLDKQPFIGLHPRYSQLAIFNGFGAKGSLQIPYYAQQFVDFLSKKQNLSAKVDIQRMETRLPAVRD
ncbi:MAG: FAD-dependent oxidoreductase [Methylococcaceae bacterium]|nr:FAD-dependent oxidoreductase [Methylococcaceae bacterium]